ncbi:MAG TPA: hypothetical protein VGJ53_05125 [Micromonosporaceae bacterium]|jgi:hypothetical protein
MRARRLGVAAALAVVGVLVLGACARSNPSVAAYVGNTAYTKSEVDRAFDTLPKDQTQRNPQALRQFIVSMMVLSEVAERNAAAAGKPLAKPTAEQVQQIARQLSLPADSAFVRLQARYQGAVQHLESEAKSTEPDDTLRREIFDGLRAQGVIPAGTTFAQVRAAIDSSELRHLVGVRTLLGDLVNRYHVRVNPAYAPLELQASVPIAGGQAQANVSIPVSIKGEQIVTDLSTPSP